MGHRRERAHLRSHVAGALELVAVLTSAAALAATLTYPFVLQMNRVGRVENADGQFSIWNVAWVARSLVVNPFGVFHANVFYPHRWTLAYSDSNLGSGLLAMPVYWATKNPYLAHNFVFLLMIVLSACGTYYLVRHLTDDRRAAAVSAVCFAFCPYVFAHTSHVQLFATAGVPFSMLAFHRLVDRPTPSRAIALGLVIAGTATTCGYYAIFVALMIGISVFIVATTRGHWTNTRYWFAIGGAATTAIVLSVPLFSPYFMLQRATGFERPMAEAVRFSANWPAYLASSALGHSWMLQLIPRWSEVTFPGFIATLFGLAGIVVGWRRTGRLREVAFLYAALGGLAFWASFGPAAGLYAGLYRVVPLFNWLRAPSRFGLVVAFALSVLAGIGVHGLLTRTRRSTIIGLALVAIAAAELATPLRFRAAPPVSPAYQLLQTLPQGVVVEMPFFARRNDFHGHAAYMLQSTFHWMPLVNGYSDYIPDGFVLDAPTLRLFPSVDAFKALQARQAKYALFHLTTYQGQERDGVVERLEEFSRYLRPLYTDDQDPLYQIVGWPELVTSGEATRAGPTN